jgi:hypothetical protein
MVKNRMDITDLFKKLPFLTIEGVAKHIGMNISLLRQYSVGIKKPSEAQLYRIQNGIHEIAEKLKEVNMIQ